MGELVKSALALPTPKLLWQLICLTVLAVVLKW